MDFDQIFFGCMLFYVKLTYPFICVRRFSLQKNCFFISCVWKTHVFHLILPPSKIENSFKC